jgi:DNA primase
MFDMLSFIETKTPILGHTSDHVAIKCPFCFGAQHHEMYCYVSINPEIKGWKCFSCGKSGHWFKLVAKLTSYDEAQQLFGDEGPNLDVIRKREKPILEEIELPTKSMWVEAAESYLHGRGVTSELVHDFGLYYCGHGHFTYRIIVPILLGGKCVSFQARSILSDVKRKYLNPKGNPLSRILYNYDRCEREQEVVLVEGVFDVFNLEKNGIPSMATFGKSISEDQINLIIDSSIKSVILMQDPDTVDKIEGTWERLNRKIKTRIIPLRDKDPAEISDFTEVFSWMIDSPYQLNQQKLQRWRPT